MRHFQKIAKKSHLMEYLLLSLQDTCWDFDSIRHGGGARSWRSRIGKKRARNLCKNGGWRGRKRFIRHGCLSLLHPRACEKKCWLVHKEIWKVSIFFFRLEKILCKLLPRGYGCHTPKIKALILEFMKIKILSGNFILF